MHSALLKVRAAAACQASRIVYGASGAVLLWRETDTTRLGQWYTAVSWLSLLPFVDVGFTATAIEIYTSNRKSGHTKEPDGRMLSLTVSYLLCMGLVVAAVGMALLISGRMPLEWSVVSPIVAMSTATAVTAVNTFFSSLLQAAGHWERTQYLPVIPYLAASVIMGAGIFGYPRSASGADSADW